MRLSSTKPDQVVRNTRNGSFYQFLRLERSKVRILPLELFPNGLLLAKSTPTLVESDLEIVVIGPWMDGMVVEGKPTCSRRVYENELIQLELEYAMLVEVYERMPTSGKGKQSRGSFKNKLINVEARIATLKRGLGFVDRNNLVHEQIEKSTVALAAKDLVLMPSGRVAKVMGFQPMGDQTYVKVRTSVRGALVLSNLPSEVLRPVNQARLCSV